MHYFYIGWIVSTLLFLKYFIVVDNVTSRDVRLLVGLDCVKQLLVV